MPKVLFLHNNLGLGGAEQLVVTAATALQRDQNCQVEILTAVYDKERNFDVTKNCLKVTCVGTFIPANILGIFTAFCTVLRLLYMTLYVFFRHFFLGEVFDAIILDGVSLPVPLLKYCTKTVCFYCHFPDMLLCTNRHSFWRRQYRWLLDTLEEVTLAAADELCVNSRYTESIVRTTFPSLKNRSMHVLYPPVDDVLLKQNKLAVANWSVLVQNFPTELKELQPGNYVVSLNRFERKKAVHRAIEALVWLKDHSTGVEFHNKQFPSLVLAGGYDPSVEENIQVYNDLVELAAKRTASHGLHIVFLRSIKDQLRWGLFYHALAVIYTASFEHFGIVNIESMAMACPVIACRSGGVKEIILHQKTGYLCDDTNEEKLCMEFGQALQSIMTQSEEERAIQRSACETRVKTVFNIHPFGKQLANILHLA